MGTRRLMHDWAGYGAIICVALLSTLFAAGSPPPHARLGGAMAQDPAFTESDAYERFMGRWSRALAPQFVAFAGVRPGESVLDVGSGTGAMAAAIVGGVSGTRVTGVDPSGPYVAYATAHVAGDRARFLVGDAQRLDLPDGAFDRTVSLLVVNFIPDREAALREMIRVTRPGGLVAAAVWDYGGGMEMLRTFWDEAAALSPAAEPRDERHMPLCRQGELAAFWRAHGLEHVEEQPITVDQRFASFDDYWAPFLGGQGPAGTYVASLAEPARAALAARLQKRLGLTSPERPFTLRATAWAVRGTRPMK